MNIVRILLVGLLLCEGRAVAQVQNLRLPDPSPKATVSQTVGLTEIAVVYHRPAVGGRKVWGELVPYGEVWRAGANENTTVSFSSPVSVAGRPLPAGTYGLHMIPTAREWTVIFSRCSVAWGSYSYDPKEDALRVTALPQPGEPAERLSYTFEDITERSAQLVLRWERLRLALPLQVDTPAVVMASMRAELRGPPRFSWQGWNRAAHYWVDHGGDLNEALRFSDEALKLGENFQTLEVRARLLEKKGQGGAAAELRARAMARATEQDLNLYGYGLLQRNQLDQALAIFRRNVSEHPASWNVHDSLGEALLAKGDRQAAAQCYDKALSLLPAKDDVNRQRIQKIRARLGSP